MQPGARYRRTLRALAPSFAGSRREKRLQADPGFSRSDAWSPEACSNRCDRGTREEWFYRPPSRADQDHPPRRSGEGIVRVLWTDPYSAEGADGLLAGWKNIWLRKLYGTPYITGWINRLSEPCGSGTSFRTAAASIASGTSRVSPARWNSDMPVNAHTFTRSACGHRQLVSCCARTGLAG